VIHAVKLQLLKSLYIICLAPLLASCATYRAEPISPADNGIALDSRTLNDARLTSFIHGALRTGATSDETVPWGLGTLTLAAIYYHPDIDVARAKLAASRAGVITAGQRPNPTLNFSGVFGTAAIVGGIPPAAIPATIGPVVNFLVETFGKRQARTEQAQNLAEAARWDIATAGWQVRARVRTGLLNLWAAQKGLSLTRQRLQLQQQLVGLLESRFANGEASALDVTRERINRAQAELSIRTFERTAAEARAQVAAAVGIPLRAMDGVKVSVEAFDHPGAVAAGISTGALRQKALTGRTDVLASLSDYAANQSALQLQVANQYPNLTLGPGYNYDIGVNKFILNPAIDFPIFNQNQGQIAQAIANRQQAAATFTALQAQIIGAIDAAVASYDGATRSLATADALLATEQRRQREVTSSFQAGNADRPTLVTTQLELAVIQTSRLDAVVAQRQALGTLEDALQQPIFDPGDTPSVPSTNPRMTAERY